MDIRLFESFVLIAETGSLTAASLKSNYSQSTLSGHLHALESYYGVPLVDRQGRGVELNKNGQLVLPYARRMLQILAESRIAVDISKNDFPQLRIGISSHTLNRMLQHGLLKVSKAYPETKITIQYFYGVKELDEALAAGRIHVGLAHSAISEQSTENRYVESLGQIPVLWVGHRALVNRYCLPQQIHQMPVIGYSPESAYYLMMNKSGWPEIRLPQFQFSDTEAVYQAVSNGIGISLLPEPMVRKDIERGEIIQLQGFKPVQLKISMVCQRTIVKRSEIQYLIKALRTSIDEVR